MQKIFTFFAALVCSMSMFALTYNVTVPAGTYSCYIAGEMNGWTQEQMTQVDDTHYTIDVAEAKAYMAEQEIKAVKAKVPAEWTDQITAWVWPTGGDGAEVVPTQEGEWYVVTHNCAVLNIIFKNGAGWNGHANQTVDMTFTENTCIEIVAGAGKATYTAVDCLESTDVENIVTTKHATKTIYNGQIVVLHDGVMFNLLGQEVK